MTSAEPELDPTPASSRRTASILLLDDDRVIATLVRGALGGPNYEVTWVSTVAEAMKETTGKKIDLALVDISLSHETGWEFLELLRASEGTRRLPVVMITGSDEAVDREKSLRMGADRYLLKPVTPETLERVVGELLAARDDLWWSLSLRSEQSTRLRELLFDTTTEIPTLALVVDELRQLIEAGESLHVYCIEIEPLFRLGERETWDSFDALRRDFARGLFVTLSGKLGNDVVIATSHTGANEFYCFARAEAAPPISYGTQEVELAARKLVREIRSEPGLTDEVAVFAGAASTQPMPLYAPRILYNAVREAKDLAERRETRYRHGLTQRMLRAIRENEITTLFQPVFDLQTMQTVGFEALSRGPAGSEIESPEVLFELARDYQLVWELETLCIQNLHDLLPEICRNNLLFFNLEAHFIQQLHHRGTAALESFLEFGNRIVIEVTERSAIRDYGTFRRTLHDLKSLGFKIAIDDCGSGYATLEAVAELKPDYLKVGHGLFHDIEKDSIRYRIVDLIARCADTIGATTIAEAIETEEQLELCRQLRIQNGQGYVLARPAPWEQIRQYVSP